MMKRVWTLRTFLALSAVAHGWLLQVAPRAQAAQDDPAPTTVEFVVTEPESPPEPEAPSDPEPEPEPEPEPAPAPVPEPVAEPSPSIEPEAVPESPPEAAEPPPELTGTTLVADGESSFSAEIGSGRARRGAIRAGVSKVVRRQPPPAKKKAPPPPLRPEPPAALPLSRLSKRPVPPQLGGALERNYPSEARRQGRAGEAKVRARVEPNGSVQFAKVASESSSKFGAACRKTLLGSKWSAPLDGDGEPVATWVTYRCKFRID